MQGASRVQTEAMVNGIKLAVEQAGNKAGPHTIKYVPLDDSTAQAGSWTPEAESANALKAAQDESTAVYIGAFNSGASKISIPILSEAGVPQISPANTYVGLTTDDPGSEPGEPDKYYPTGDRTYSRIVPQDTIQAAALVTLMKQDGCTKVAMTNDKEVYGAGLARVIEIAAEAAGPRAHRQRRDRQERGELPLAGLRRPRAPALTASCTRASPPTTRSSCTRTSRRRCRTRSSTARTASPRPASPPRRTAASRRRSTRASR